MAYTPWDYRELNMTEHAHTHTHTHTHTHANHQYLPHSLPQKSHQKCLEWKFPASPVVRTLRYAMKYGLNK